MSYLISGLNVKNVFEYDPLEAYSRYDIVDFQLTTGAARMPNFTGLGQTGLTSWFNNDSLSDFLIDSNFYVTGWLNKVSGSGNLLNTTSTTNAELIKPYVNFNDTYLQFQDAQTLTGTGFASPTRTVFFAIEILEEEQNAAQTIFQFGAGPVGSGTVRLSGSNVQEPTPGLTGSIFYIDNTQCSAVSTSYGQNTFLTIVQDTGSLTLRQNGFDIGTITPYSSYWKSGEFKLAQNTSSQGINFHEIIHFTGVLPESEIDYYEKYLFEKYSDLGGLYFARVNVPSGEQRSPITFTGQSYWTKDVDVLFDLTYGCSATFTSKMAPLKFGDGYKTNVINGVNPITATFSLNYDGLTDIQAKSLITFFENSPERAKKSLYEGFEPIEMNLFAPYRRNAEVYFTDISHKTVYNNINSVKITAESVYVSLLDYEGMNVPIDNTYCRTYSTILSDFTYNDIFYYGSDAFEERGYYFYTGANVIYPVGTYLPAANSPTGANTLFTKEFYFKTDLVYGLDTKTRFLTNDFKNSTKEYEKDGINYNELEFEVNFSKRSLREATAILKFLDDKAGYKIFNYTLPQPYNKTISVYCPEWNHSYDFLDNHTVNAKFVEFKNAFEQESLFNTVISFVAQ
jgi:phage-related protein